MTEEELLDRMSDALFDSRKRELEAAGLWENMDPWKVRIICNDDAENIVFHRHTIYEVLKEHYATAQETQDDSETGESTDNG